MSDRYALEKHVASRRAAESYSAVDTQTGLHVRFHRLKTGLAINQLQVGLDFLTHLKRSFGEINSPSIAPIWDCGIDADGLWYVSNEVPGVQLLSEKVEAMDVDRFSEMSTQLLTALSLAHQKGLVHGAISPNGVLVTENSDGTSVYQFADLGFRRLYQLLKNDAISGQLPAEPVITAPELFNLLEEADAASDVYMIGQVFYMMLTGGHPWVGRSDEEVRQKHLSGSLPRANLVNTNVPEDWAAWLAALTVPDPYARPQDAAAALALMPQPEIAAEVVPVAPINDASQLASANDSSKGGLLYAGIAFIVVAIVTCFSFFIMKQREGNAGEVANVTKPATPVVEGDDDLDDEPVNHDADAKSDDPKKLTSPGTTTSAEDTSVADGYVVIRPVVSGSVSGDTYYWNSSQIRVGRGSRKSNLWGSGGTSEAKGPDLNNTWRSIGMFKTTPLWTDHALFKDEDSLDRVNVEVSFKVTSRGKLTRGDFAPMIALKTGYEGQGPEYRKKATVDMTKAVACKKDGDTYTCMFEGADLDKSKFRYFAIVFVGNRKARRSEWLGIDQGSFTVKVIKR